MVRVWDTVSRREVAAFTNCSEAWFSPDGQVLATLRDGKTIDLWKVPFRSPLWRIFAWTVLVWLMVVPVAWPVGWMGVKTRRKMFSRPSMRCHHARKTAMRNNHLIPGSHRHRRLNARSKQWQQVKPVGTVTNGQPLDEEAASLAKYATIAYIDADEWGIKNKIIEQFPLDGNERAILAAQSVIPAVLKRKLGKKTALTVVDVISLVVVISESLVEADAEQQASLLGIAKKLKDCLQENIVRPKSATRSKKSKSTGTVFQLKITLKESQPPIWRRILVKDCTLDKLHEHIQTAMGWTNSHLHHFEVGRQLYGDPMLIGDNFDDMEYEDSTATNLSDIIPENRRKFRFDYEQ